MGCGDSPKERRDFTKQEKISENKNYIIAEIYVSETYINENIRIISSYEEALRETKSFYKKGNSNTTEIVNNCEIRIDDIEIPFSYFYKFTVSGKYIMKYSFANYITNTNYLFYNCSSLTNLDLSNFNTQNVTKIQCMFYGCSSLTNLNSSNFNTQNVTNMNGMFYGCSSLTNLNLSNFNTQKLFI